MRGGAPSYGSGSFASDGRSPRARGSLTRGTYAASSRRSIPACAGEPTTRPARAAPGGVDPRVRGGAQRNPLRWWARKGRSPRARGSPVPGVHHHASRGSIPACAGEPGARTAARSRSRVDPRLRGGAVVPAPAARARSGRSPRARGSREVRVRVAAAPGSIPACAGEPRGNPRRRAAAWVDPRVRGGAEAERRHLEDVAGRSPRARGSRRAEVEALGRLRSIPACAGEPRSPARGSSGRRVDPRVRGGASAPSTTSFADVGRSPRARGSRRTPPPTSPPPRSIPACAGEPRSRCTAAARSRVDPRVRGGAGAARWIGRASGGRSPRARGSHVLRAVGLAVDGSIPACAGEPASCRGSPSRRAVDPRVRGGASDGGHYCSRNRGRSPRARGSPDARPPLPSPPRSIPACAGEPPDGPGLLKADEVDPRVRARAANHGFAKGMGEGRSPRARGSRRAAGKAPCA